MRGRISDQYNRHPTIDVFEMALFNRLFLFYWCVCMFMCMSAGMHGHDTPGKREECFRCWHSLFTGSEAVFSPPPCILALLGTSEELSVFLPCVFCRRAGMQLMVLLCPVCLPVIEVLHL